MVFRKKIPERVKAYVKLLREEQHLSLRAIARKCDIAWSSVKRILDGPRKYKARKPGSLQRGRPRKISKPQERHLLRQLKKLREVEGTFSVSRLMAAAGISEAHVTRRTVLNVLHRNGYRFRQARKKGLLTRKDLKVRKKFALRMVKRPAEFWCRDVAFYLDCVSFVHKTNPVDQARTPKSRIYRKANEGLLRCCTTKGRKEGSGGSVAKFVVAISHGKGVVLCKSYETMNGEFFANFVDDHFEEVFSVCDKETNCFLQDGDPSQNSAKAMQAIRRVPAEVLNIPPRSPDLNAIENIFHLTGKQLRQDALSLNIKKETFEQFQLRVENTLTSTPMAVIDKTIESTRGRLLKIIEKGGHRTKY